MKIMICKLMLQICSIYRDIVDWLILIASKNFVISLTVIGITKVVEFSSIASQRTVREEAKMDCGCQ